MDDFVREMMNLLENSQFFFLPALMGVTQLKAIPDPCAVVAVPRLDLRREKVRCDSSSLIWLSS